MAIGIVGRKAGMTRVFTDDGVSVPVTVKEVEPNRVTQVRSAETDGYSAIQVTVGAFVRRVDGGGGVDRKIRAVMELQLRAYLTPVT